MTVQPLFLIGSQPRGGYRTGPLGPSVGIATHRVHYAMRDTGGSRLVKERCGRAERHSHVIGPLF